MDIHVRAGQKAHTVPVMYVYHMHILVIKLGYKEIDKTEDA